MDTAINVWNLLWDYQIHIVVAVVFVVWFIVRGSDVIRWVGRKLRPHRKPTGEARKEEHQEPC